MKLSEYYTPEPIDKIVRVLSNKRLSHERHREDVNKLVVNLVIKYMAEYLECADKEIGEIQEIIREAADATHKVINPQAVLLEMMSSMLGGPPNPELAETDAFGIQCIIDIQQTAAIVKEIIFNDRFKTPDGDFVGVDLGSGTGILTLATALAGRRSSAVRHMCLGIEKQSIAVRKSTATLEKILRPEEFKIEHIDLLKSEGVMRIFEGLPLSFWVSETISTMTPPVRIRNDQAESEENSINDIFAEISGKQFDPFPQIIKQTTRERPQFVREVKQGKTAMFPDLVNGDFVPNLAETIMRVRTAPWEKTHLPLHQIGREFEGFEEIFKGASTSEGNMRFAPNNGPPLGMPTGGSLGFF